MPPARSTGWPQEDLVGTVEILGDVVSPVLAAGGCCGQTPPVKALD